MFSSLEPRWAFLDLPWAIAYYYMVELVLDAHFQVFRLSLRFRTGGPSNFFRLSPRFRSGGSSSFFRRSGSYSTRLHG